MIALVRPPLDFVHAPAPSRVVFAGGAPAGLPDETDRLGLTRGRSTSPPSTPRCATLGGALGEAADPARALQDLATGLGAPRSLADLGALRSDLPAIAAQAAASPNRNPRHADEHDIAALLDRAWQGDTVPETT